MISPAFIKLPGYPDTKYRFFIEMRTFQMSAKHGGQVGANLCVRPLLWSTEGQTHRSAPTEFYF